MFWTKLILQLVIYIHLQPTTYAININLSSLWNLFGYDNNVGDYASIREQLIIPRRNLVQDLGGNDEYQRLVKYSLGLEEDSYDNNRQGVEDYSNDENDENDGNDHEVLQFGVDVSFPIQHDKIKESNNDQEDTIIDTLKQQQTKVYNQYIAGCNKHYLMKYSSTSTTKKLPLSEQPCYQAELDRFDMNLNQPPVMQNYTMLGFHKTTIPKDLQYLLSKFWKKHQTKQKIEVWDKGQGSLPDTHVNHWVSPTYMVHIDNPYLDGGGMELKNYIWHVARQKLENWINNGGGVGEYTSNGSKESKSVGTSFDDGRMWTLSPTSLYGIRVYKENSILAPHVDRLPLVTSAIINVDQDVDEEWPLELIGHDGIAYNITMKPGDMLLYESHSVIHGRPYPLKGKYYANIFVHFEPTGHCIRHADRFEGKDVVIEDAKVLYERAQAKLKEKLENEREHFNEHSSSRTLSSEGDTTDGEEMAAPSTPAYIKPGSIEEKRWNQKLEYKMNMAELKSELLNLHTTAGRGNLAEIMYAFKLDPKSVLKKDNNGWQPLHEAIRAGHLPVVEFLIEEAGADKNARTGLNGMGGSPLWWALKFHKADHPVVVYLLELGAEIIAPDQAWPPKKEKSVAKEDNDEDKDNTKKDDKKGKENEENDEEERVLTEL